MQYLLLISADEETAVTRMREGAFASFDTWITDLEQRGVLRTHVGLHESATASPGRPSAISAVSRAGRSDGRAGRVPSANGAS